MESRVKTIYKVTLIGSLVNIVLTVGKIVVGIFGNSSAMIADGIHSASDLTTDFVLLLFVKISSRPRDNDHDYGHGKFETLGSAIIATSLGIVGFLIIWSSVDSIFSVIKGNILKSPSLSALIAAAISIIAKEALYRYTITVGKRINSNAVVSNAWHHRSDALSSVGTFIGIGLAHFLGEKWTVLDPITALIVSFFILKVAYQLLLPSLQEMLEISLPDDIKKNIINIATSTSPDVSDLHNLKTRRIGPDIAIEFHLRVNGNMTVKAAHDITVDIEKRLKATYGSRTHISIHLEPETH